MINIEDVIKLKENGFSIDEIKSLMNTESPQTKVEETNGDSKENVKNNEDIIEDKKDESNEGNELNAMEEMMKQFKDSMTQQMEAFKQTIQLSNMRKDIGGEENESRKIAEEFTANIINPNYKK